MKSIAIGVPVRYNIDGTFFSSINNILDQMRKNYNVTLIIDSEYPLDLSRNNIVQKAIKIGCEKIIFIDTDILVSVETLTKLLSYDYDIIGGVYNLKVKPYNPLIYEQVTENTYIEKLLYNMDVTEVDGIGIGLCVIKMSVFETLPYPWFKNEWFFEYNRYGVLSEDLYFCREAKKKGYKIMCDPNLQATHVGGNIIMAQYLIFSSANTEFVANKKIMIKEAADYLGVPIQDVWGWVSSAKTQLLKEWYSINDEARFYKESRAYIYDLIRLHISTERESDMKLREKIIHKQSLMMNRPLKILEVGCCIAQNGIILSEAGLDVSIMNLPGCAYDFAKYRIKSRKLRMDCYELNEILKKKFDIVVCYNTLEHIPDNQFDEFVQKIKSMLKDDGTVELRYSFGTTDEFPMHYNLTPSKQLILNEIRT